MLKTRGAVSTLKTEIQVLLKSEEFQTILQATIKIAVTAALQDIVEPMKKRIDALEAKVLNIESNLANVLVKANDNEQYSRRHNIRVSGFDEGIDEDCIDKIVKFCNEKLDVEIVNEQIDRAHRVGKSNGNKARAIIVRFKARADKISVSRKRRTLVGTGFHVNKDLTKYNQKLLSKAKKESVNVSSNWSSDGKIFVKRSSDERRLRIVTMADFAKYELI